MRDVGRSSPGLGPGMRPRGSMTTEFPARTTTSRRSRLGFPTPPERSSQAVRKLERYEVQLPQLAVAERCDQYEPATFQAEPTRWSPPDNSNRDIRPPRAVHPDNHGFNHFGPQEIVSDFDIARGCSLTVRRPLGSAGVRSSEHYAVSFDASARSVSLVPHC